MIVLVVFLTVAIHSVVPAPTADDLIVSLPNGKVQGTSYVTDNNKTFYAFQGIPYGAPPVGNLRFEAPQPAQPWDGIFDATKDGYTCMSALNSLPGYAEIENEDCLNLNVYIPILKPVEKLPVMLWIYGGKFVTGNALRDYYGPDFLIEEDIVFVAMNYRLGPFGFLSTGDTSITGNFGLKDQLLAMRWVKENIEYFGGDPDKITIFGESAGGASTSLQLVSEKSAGLYRAAIVESGTALTYWTIDKDPMSYTTLLAQALDGGDYVNDTQILKKFLQGKTAKELNDAANSFKSVGGVQVSLGADFSLPSVQAWPVVEVENEDAFLSESPYVLLESGRFNQVPTIIGFCANEAVTQLGDLDAVKKLAEQYDTVPSLLIPADLYPNSTDVDAAAKAIKNIYLKEEENFTTNLIPLVSYASDNYFARATIKTAELQVKHVPVYFYQFAYYGRATFPSVVEGAEKAGHGAELGFLFKMYNSNTTDPSDILTQNRIVRLWANFAKYLNPTPEKSELLNNVTWPVTSPTDNQFTFLNINNTLEVRSQLRPNYPEWTDVFDTYGRKPFITY